MADTGIERMFLNAGSSLGAEASKLGVSADMLNDQSNWHNGNFVNPLTGVVWQYIFGYDGFAQWVRL